MMLAALVHLAEGLGLGLFLAVKMTILLISNIVFSVILYTDIYSGFSLYNLYKSEIFIQFLRYYMFR
jgi:hypothetical protein